MKRVFQNLCLTFFSILFAFGLAEGFLRIYRSQYSLKNYLEEKKTLLHSSYPVQFDPKLGWIPKIGFSGDHNFWGTQVAIGAKGIRSNGHPQIFIFDNSVLAIGDSYTFGDQVSDHETWPALLENLLKRPVLNGGVFGYGIDQSYLRAQQLITEFHPEILVFSFVPDDIRRCGLSARASANKPYFEKQGDQLLLHTEHLHPPESIGEIHGIRKLLGYSYLIHSVMHQLAPVYWYEGRWSSQVAHQDEEWVACRLLRNLEMEIQKSATHQLIILAQYPRSPKPEEYALVNRVLTCLQDPNTKIVDLKNPLQEVKSKSPSRYQKFFSGHMTREGNEFVAQQLIKVFQDQPSQQNVMK